MSKGWKTFIFIGLTISALLGAYQTRELLDFMKKNQMLVEENKALKEKNKPVYKYLRLEVYSILFSISHGRVSYAQPTYAVRYGVIHPYSKQFVIVPQKGSIEVWEKQQIFPHEDNGKNLVNVKMLPSLIGYMKSENLKRIESIQVDDDYNFYIYLKKGINLSDAYRVLADINTFYADEYLSY